MILKIAKPRTARLEKVMRIVSGHVGTEIISAPDKKQEARLLSGFLSLPLGYSPGSYLEKRHENPWPSIWSFMDFRGFLLAGLSLATRDTRAPAEDQEKISVFNIIDGLFAKKRLKDSLTNALGNV